MQWLWAGTIVLMLVGLSGCVAEEASDDAASEESEATEETESAGDADEETETEEETEGADEASESAAPGSISGTVTDAELVPLAGAMVMVEGLESMATSDEAGAFSIADVPAGAYNLTASLEGYESATASVEVLDGAVAEVSIVLNVLAAAGPTYVTQVGQGLLSCGAGLVVVTAAGDAACTVAFPSVRTIAFTMAPGVTQSLHEIVWVPSQSLVGSALRSINNFNGAAAGEISGPTPIVLVNDDYDADDTDEQTFSHFFWAAFGSANTGAPTQSINAHLNQHITIYMTAFYGSPVPEGFSGVPA